VIEKNYKRKKPRKLTPIRLANIALYYLSRYAASEASLRKVLENRLRKAIIQDEELSSNYENQEKLKEAINEIVEKHKKSGAINDKEYSFTKVLSFRRSGGSTRKIYLKLQQKGIDKKLIEDALKKAEEESEENSEEVAALSYARKRRLGEFRSKLSLDRMSKEKLSKLKEKDYATMARAGFSYDIIKKII